MSSSKTSGATAPLEREISDGCFRQQRHLTRRRGESEGHCQAVYKSRTNRNTEGPMGLSPPRQDGLKPRRVDSTRGTIHLLFTSTILNTSYCTILCIFTVVLKCFELVQCVFCITFSKPTHVFFYWENIPGQFSIIV